MNKIKELKNTHVICFSIMVILINNFLSMTIGTLLNIAEFINESTNLYYMLRELIVFVIAIFMLKATYQTHVLRHGTKGLVQGLWSGMVFFVLAVLACSSSVSDGIAQNITYKPLPEIIAFILFVILIGFAEEFLFRGIIADIIFEHFGNSVSGVLLSVVLGGILFGIAHVTNILSGKSVEETIIQMIATSMLGILLTAIYIRHKNIFAVAILHAVLDFLTMFERGFFEGNLLQYTNVDIDFWASLKQSLISQSIFLIVAAFILRPSIIKKMRIYFLQNRTRFEKFPIK